MQQLGAVTGNVLMFFPAFLVMVAEVRAHQCISQSPSCGVGLVQPTLQEYQPNIRAAASSLKGELSMSVLERGKREQK